MHVATSQARDALGREATDSRQAGAAPAGPGESLAKALGWLSLGLGIPSNVAPEAVAGLIGVSPRGSSITILRAVGLREMAAGVGILIQPRPTPWLWSRVFGDAMDLALAARALGSPKADRARLTRTMLALLGIAGLDLFASLRMSRETRGQGIHVRKAVTINRPPEELYAFWRNFQNLPQAMSHLEAVQPIGGRRSRWQAKAPAGVVVMWEAEIVDDQPNELIAWRSLEGADVDNSGSVRFRPAPGGRGTEVEVELSYSPPAGRIGQLVAKLLGEEPGQQVADDLRHLKQVIETGEVIVSDATIRGAKIPQPPAQPPQDPSKRKPRLGLFGA